MADRQSLPDEDEVLDMIFGDTMDDGFLNFDIENDGGAEEESYEVAQDVAILENDSSIEQYVQMASAPLAFDTGDLLEAVLPRQTPIAPPPGSHRAFELGTIGGRLEEAQRPTPGAFGDNILIKVMVFGINRQDQLKRDSPHYFSTEDLPVIMGTDFAGIVVGMGPDVVDKNISDRVFGMITQESVFDGAFQEYILLPSRRTAKIPLLMSYEEAAIFPTNAWLAYNALFNKELLFARVPTAPDNNPDVRDIVIIGGETDAGRFAIQLAQRAAFQKIIAIYARPQHIHKLFECGASHVVCRFTPGVRERVYGIVPQGADCVLEFREQLEAACEAEDAHFFGTQFLPSERVGRYVAVSPWRLDPELHQGPCWAPWKVPLDRHEIETAATFEATEMSFWDNIAILLRDSFLKPIAYARWIGMEAYQVNEALDTYIQYVDAPRLHVHVFPL